MANLPAQAYGLDGSTLTFATASAGGDVATNGPGAVLAVRNVNASLTRTITLEAFGLCNAKRLHDLVGVSIAPTPAGGKPVLIPLGWDPLRFARISLVYADAPSAADLRIALARMGSLQGFGVVDVTAPAMGPAPVRISRVGQETGDALEFTAADADGMLVENRDGRTGLVAINDDAVARGVYVRAAFPCAQGFLDHYYVEIPPTSSPFQLKRFRPEFFGADLSITYDDPTGLSFAAIRLAVEGE